MYYNNETILFPAVTKISFSKLIEHITEQLKLPGASQNKDLSSLLEECKKYPEITAGIPIESFNKNLNVIQRLCATLFRSCIFNEPLKRIWLLYVT